MVGYTIGNQYRQLNYTYDDRGFIASRTDTKVNQTESYYYDELDRLESYTVNGVTAGSFGYDHAGNILTNSKVGTYLYGSNRPHAVNDIEGSASCPIPSWQCNTSYNLRNRPASISENGYSITLDYSADGMRRNTRFYSGSTLQKKVTRVSELYEKEVTSLATRHLDYIYAEGRVVALHVKNGNADSLYYILTDHLGSWNKVMRQNKTIVQQTHFDPWGNRMDYTRWDRKQATVSFSFHRGFTGHEHYDRFKVVNANARLYDPVIGRFFSPDPFVQAPDFTQNFNRYSYCLNNPVMYSDEDGEFWHIIAGAIIGGVYNWLVNGAELSWQGLAYFGIGAAAGALGAGVGAGLASVYAGSTFSAGFMGSVTTASSSLGVIGGFSSGFAGGFVNGFTSGLGNGLIQTKSFTMALGNAFENGIQQGFAGGVTGGLAGGYFAYMAGNHPLTGQKPYLDISLKNYQNVLQNNPSNCKNAILESIEKMNGGTRTQDDFKKLGDAYLEAHPNAHLEEYFENLGFNVEDPSTKPEGTIEDAFRNNYPIVVEDATTFGGHTMTLVRIRQWTPNSQKWIWFADPSQKGLSKFLFDYLFETKGLYLFKL